MIAFLRFDPWLPAEKGLAPDGLREMPIQDAGFPTYSHIHFHTDPTTTAHIHILSLLYEYVSHGL